MRAWALALMLLLGASLLVGCGRPPPPPRPAVTAPAAILPVVGRALIVVEAENSAAPEANAAAQALKVLLAHFELRGEIISAGQYRAGQLARYKCAFYLASSPGSQLAAGFITDLADYEGTVVWVGPGVQRLGKEALEELGLSAQPAGETLAEAADWTIAYGGQEHKERLALPEVEAGREARVLAPARRGRHRRPFLAGNNRLWYGAAGPSLAPERVWTACIWADALHEIVAIPHQQDRKLLAVLRDVPVWARETQVPGVVSPMLEADLPVAIFAHTYMQETALADRPDAVESLRAAEALGGVVVLQADADLDAREHLRLAWEVGLHPVAWAGPAGEANPFHLIVADRKNSPPYAAGGLLPAPIPISDAGYYAARDMARLHMQRVVRDAVALISFGLWAPSRPFLGFFRGREAEGWRRADLRELGAVVSDPRRLVVSGETKVRVTWPTRVRQTVLGREWEVKEQEVLEAPRSDSDAQITVKPPEGSVAVLEPVRVRKPRTFIKGVTLDPWRYRTSGLTSKLLAEFLAERYARNGVNTVFFYAYNVKEGAGYRTRYPGATISAWGRQDLLKEVLQACHARGIRVVAWMYSGRDHGMWWKHPEWRERTREGKVYNPLRLHATYFLCPRNPEVQRWYSGLVRDLGRRYPSLDGIELCEPLVNWWGDSACYCEVCREEFAAAYPGKRLGGPEWHKHRAEGLTKFLSACMQAISEMGIDSYILTICDAWSNGALLTPRRQAWESGLDMEALLEGPYPPDWVNFEVIWQQWANIYSTDVFNYEWASETAKRLNNRTDGRARVVFHVEITDFGKQRMTAEKTAETIRHVMAAEPEGIECYHSAALDRKSAWGVLKRAYQEIP